MPDEITADYVERVLNEINRVDAELTRDILRRPVDEDAVELPSDLDSRLTTIYAEPIITPNRRSKVDLLRSQDQRDDLVQPEEFGQLRMDVEEVLSASPCTVVRVDRDFTEVDAEPDTDKSNLAFVFMVHEAAAIATGWRIASIVGSDAAPDSADEEALRALDMADLTAEAPEVCQ